MAGAGPLSRTPGVSGPAEPEDTCGWRCPEHSDRAAELFCRRCRHCVCALCPVLGAHRDHAVGLALEEAAHVKVGTLGRQGPGGASPGSNCQFPLGPGNLKAAQRSSRRPTCLLFRKRK